MILSYDQTSRASNWLTSFKTGSLKNLYSDFLFGRDYSSGDHSGSSGKFFSEAGTVGSDLSAAHSKLSGALGGILATGKDVLAKSKQPTAPKYPTSPVAPGALPDYLYADLAKAYGMDASTAYQEALSNTSYQRAIKDMQAAGLNPGVLFGARAASPADGVAYATPIGAGVSSGVSSAKSTAKWYKSLSNLGTLIGALASKRGTGAFAGRAVGGALGNILDSLSNQ